MRVTECDYHYISNNNTFQPTKAECVVFYCLLVHIMYIIHNKATFIVIENKNPNIRNNKNFTINNHLLALDVSSIESGSLNISAISFSLFYTI